MLARSFILISIGLLVGCSQKPIPLPASVLADDAILHTFVEKRVEIVGTFGHFKIGPHIVVGKRALALYGSGGHDPKWPNDTFPQADTKILAVGTLEYTDNPLRRDQPYSLRNARVYPVPLAQNDRGR